MSGGTFKTSQPAPGLWDRLKLEAFITSLGIGIALNSLLTRKRMSHENGLLAAGRIKIVEDPQLPDNDFFEPGAEFPCRLRHAGVSFMDDSRLVVRGGSVKWTDAKRGGPLDLLMNTGQIGFFWDAWTFAEFAFHLTWRRDPRLVPFLQKYPDVRRTFADSYRRNPESFAKLHYYSQTPLLFKAKDGVERYIKFRMIPADGQAEAGLPDWDDEPWDAFWTQLSRPRPGEAEPPGANYLKNEYRDRVAEAPVNYRIQTQIHEWKEGDSRELFSCLYTWDDATHPWRDLAEVEIDRTFSVEDGNDTIFKLSNLPDCLEVIQALDVHDPPSLDALRLKGRWARTSRLLSCKLFGPPKLLPDDGRD